MTRKDYISLSSTLNSTRPLHDAHAHNQWKRDVEALSAALQGTNPRYNRSRFVAACYGEA